MKWIIVGLGNPDGEYAGTRHNTGRIVLDEFRQAHDLPDWEEKKLYKALVSGGKVGKTDALLIEPETTMNNFAESCTSRLLHPRLPGKNRPAPTNASSRGKPCKKEVSPSWRRDLCRTEAPCHPKGNYKADLA